LLVAVLPAVVPDSSPRWPAPSSLHAAAAHASTTSTCPIALERRSDRAAPTIVRPSTGIVIQSRRA
jgi:hypothetical protein